MLLNERKGRINKGLAAFFAALIVAIYLAAVWRVQYTNAQLFWILLCIAALSFYTLYRTFTRKWREREEMVAKPFPEKWRKILQDNVGFYRTLSEEDKQKFETEIQIFLHETRVTGIQCEVDDLTLVLAAASAEIPVFRFPDWEYENLGEILIYPNSFTKDFRTEGEGRNVWGMVGTGAMENIMILSKPALIGGFQNVNDKSNVGIHEFAHLLDGADGNFDGVPEKFLQSQYLVTWLEVMHMETQRIKSGESKMNPYGATAPVEFFAVATEYFFENPQAMKQNKPQLYEMMQRIFQQDTRTQFASAFYSMFGYTGKKVGRNAPCPCRSGKNYKDCCLKNARTY